MKKYLNILKDSTLSILPIVLIVLALSFTGLAKLNSNACLLIAIATVLLILGLTTFQIGSEKSLVIVGKYMGESLSRQPKLFIIIIIAFILGALVTCAEPSIMLLSSQIPIPSWLLILAISSGVGIFVVIGIIRIIKHRNLKIWMIAFYGLIFALLLLIDSNTYSPIIFDSAGATTGSATVPFLLSLGASVAMVRGGKFAKDDSFGLIGIASIGPLISLTLLIIFNSNGLTSYSSDLDLMSDTSNIFLRFINHLIPTFKDGKMVKTGVLFEVLLALIPILVIFIIYELIYIKLPRNEIFRILFGFLYTFIGLSIFLCAVETAMMPIGRYVGDEIGKLKPVFVILIAFSIGLVTILCEPAIHVLTKQVEDISDGGIKKLSVLLTLSIGVGIATALCAIRSIFNFSIIYYLVPLYILSLALSFASPNLYTAMAFDSGGVASGPMTTSFVLPMIIGISYAFGATDNEIMGRAFGVIAMVALIPIIAIQILGILDQTRIKRMTLEYFSKPIPVDDSEIIHFEA